MQKPGTVKNDIEEQLKGAVSLEAKMKIFLNSAKKVTEGAIENKRALIKESEQELKQKKPTQEGLTLEQSKAITSIGLRMSKISLLSLQHDLAIIDCGLKVCDDCVALARQCFESTSKGKETPMEKILDSIKSRITTAVNQINVLAKIQPLNKDGKKEMDSLIDIYKQTLKQSPPVYFITGYTKHNQAIQGMYNAELTHLVTLADFVLRNHETLISMKFLPQDYFKTHNQTLNLLQNITTNYAKYLDKSYRMTDDVRQLAASMMAELAKHTPEDIENMVKEHEAQQQDHGVHSNLPKPTK